jgi:hypothetical protein
MRHLIAEQKRVSGVQIVPKTVYFVTKDKGVASAWDFALNRLGQWKFVHVDLSDQGPFNANTGSADRNDLFMVYGTSREEIDEAVTWIRSNSTGYNPVIGLGYHKIDCSADERDSLFEGHQGYTYFRVPFELPMVIDLMKSQAPTDGNHPLPNRYYEREKRDVLHYSDNLSGRNDLSGEAMKAEATQRISQLLETGVAAEISNKELDELKNILLRIEGAETKDTAELREILHDIVGRVL